MKRVLMICAIALAVSATSAYAGATVKPYGFVLVNAQFNTSWNGDIPVFASQYEDETANKKAKGKAKAPASNKEAE